MANAAACTAPELIALCARGRSHPGFAERLRRALDGFGEWGALPELAEAHGLAPLVYAHLQAVAPGAAPEPVLLALRGLALRHQRAAAIYDEVLGEILAAFVAAGIGALALKGAALAHLVYPQARLRPRRDLDILVEEAQAGRAYALLGELGFATALSPMQGVSRYHQHCREATRTSRGLLVTVDLHVNLFFRFKPYGLPSGTYAELAATAQPFDLNGLAARTLGPEEMLWHLYHHGFSPPSRATSDGRLLGAADMISVVELWLDRIDWARVRCCYPQVLDALPMLHHLTPWSEAVIDRLALDVARVPDGVGHVYGGYPRQVWGEHVRRGLRRSLRETFWPPEWWVRLHYGLPPAAPLAAGRARHARHVLADLGIYATSLLGPLRLHPYDE